MKTLHEIQENSLSHFKKLAKYSNLFTNDYLNLNSLFTLHFNVIPNEINLPRIDTKGAYIWFFERYNSEIIDVFFRKINSQPNFENIIFLLFDDLFIEFNNSQSSVKLVFRKTNYSHILELINVLKIFEISEQSKNTHINIIVADTFGIELQPLKIKQTEINIPENYNDDFIEVHNTMSLKLSRKDNYGIVLLHGAPGTGKTSYVRYLISKLSKIAIFLPPNMAEHLSNPELTNLLIRYPNSILIIEDAEKTLISREKDNNSGLSTLLNISDGLLADLLNIQIICTFNIDITKIDAALLRKGRLITKYEFKELEITKAAKLSQKLGFKNEINRSMTLAEIYNQNEQCYKENPVEKSIGFKN